MVRGVARAVGMTSFEETKALTIASELGRNMLHHASGGRMTVEPVEHDGRHGIVMRFEDEGPGIEDLDAAFVDGFTTGGGLGLGLGGSRRMAHAFSIDRRDGGGIVVSATLYRKK